MLPEPIVVSGERIFELVTGRDTLGCGVALVELVQSEEHWHDHTQEVYILLSGEVEVYLNNGPVRLLKFGDAVVIPAGTRHWAWRLHDEPTRLLVVSEPPWTPEDHHLV